VAIRRVAIVGCGLIGGSLAKALARKKGAYDLRVVDRAAALPAIKSARIPAERFALEDIGAALADREIVILATPVEAILQLLETLVPHLRRGMIVTDVGSTKAVITDTAAEMMPPGVQFIGGHPLAGSATPGPRAADALLFKDRTYFLCPTPETRDTALLTLIDLVENVLARPVTIEPEEHDRLLAATSHVPQLLATALMHTAGTIDREHGMLEMVVGPGFLDMTRVASSDFAMWEGVLETNQAAISEALDLLTQGLDEVRSALASARLEELWNQARDARRTLGRDPASQPRLADHRARINALDEALLKLVAERMKIAEQIGQVKKERDLPVQDDRREKSLLGERAKWGDFLDLDPGFVTRLFELLMEQSRRRQK
jgi:prephenate dehydrogenase